MLHHPGINDIRAAVEKFKNKKILVIIDYVQMFARKLQAYDDKPSDFLRKYTSYIYAMLDDIRSKYNVCFYLLSNLSKAGISEVTSLLKFDDLKFLNGIKEDGNIMYDMDYIYAMLLADENEKKRKNGRLAARG
jgi:hypothetical protein